MHGVLALTPAWGAQSLSFTFMAAMMLVDALLYLLLALYTDLVFPGSYGIPQSPLFFLRRRFWFPSARPSAAMAAASDAVVASHVAMGYARPGGCSTAAPVLRDVSLRLVRGEITALFGPNGAGKVTPHLTGKRMLTYPPACLFYTGQTTLISVLTGLFAPTAGDIDVFGHSYARSGFRTPGWAVVCSALCTTAGCGTTHGRCSAGY